MKKRPVSPTAIGTFVLGAITIAVMAVILFGSGRWFGGERVSFVCFFDDAVDGMQIGSKVKLKGVPIGKVTRILIRFKQSEEGETTKPLIPVIIEVDLERLSNDLGVDMDFRDEILYQAQIKDGLRASLGMENLITGILQVNLDYESDAEAPADLEPFTYRGQVYRVIPTLPSQMAQATNDLLEMVSNISNADFKGVVDGLNELLEKLNGKLDQFEVKGMNEALESFQALMESPKFGETLDAFAKAAEAATEATKGIREVADNLNEQLSDEVISNALVSADETFLTLTEAIEKLEVLLESGANVPGELEASLKEFNGMAAEIKELAAYLKERPNALLFGRKDEDPKVEEPSTKPPRKPWKRER
ncbi:MAG: paraquat-inducible protein B [Verrucomicrobiales bacterium]|jgi:paraquat-inducible protein B